jgi:hypothetical protein
MRFRRIPQPSYRHAAPSGPWPWVDECDLADSLDELNELESRPTPVEPIPLVPCGHINCDDCPQWNKYPQSQFGNWTPKPVAKCKIAEVVLYQHSTCVIRYVDVKDSGVFEGYGKYEVSLKNLREHWWDVVNIQVRNPWASIHVVTNILLATPRVACTGIVCRPLVRACPTDAWNEVCVDYFVYHRAEHQSDQIQH